MDMERRVDAFDLTDTDGRDAYEDLVNRSNVHVQSEITSPMSDGSVLRVVDFKSPSEVVKTKEIYVKPVC